MWMDFDFDGNDQPTITAPNTMPFSAPPVPAPRHRARLVAAFTIAVLGSLVGGFFIGRAAEPDKDSSAAPTATTALASGASTSGNPQDTVPSNDAILQQALGFHTAGNLDEAARLYNVILASDPGNKYAHFNLGQIAQTRGQLDAAITEYKAALATDPNYGPALYNSGLAYGADGDLTNGIAMLRKALEVSPNSAPTMFNLGTMLIANGDQTEGADLLAQAIAIDPSLKPAEAPPDVSVAP
jgi:tetratricopeptide (TPR) repeat protein